MQSFRLENQNIKYTLLRHPRLKEVAKVKQGFSWPCLLFGSFWYFYKGMIAWGVLTFLVALFTLGLSWLFFPFFANKQYVDHLVARGYKEVG